jgi:hypothetical protein
MCIFRCALTVARSAPYFAVAIATANPLALLSCVSKDQVRLLSLLSKNNQKKLWLTTKQICSCAECLPDVVVDLIKPMCSNAKLMSRDVDESIAPPYAEYMAVTEDSVHHQAIRV